MIKNRAGSKKWCLWFCVSFGFLLIISTFLPYNLNENQKIAGHKIRLDYLMHLGVYTVLSFSFFCSKKNNLSFKMLSFYISAGLIFSLVLELLQILVPYRTFNILDVMFNGIGILLGIGIWKIMSAIRNQHKIQNGQTQGPPLQREYFQFQIQNFLP